MNLYKLSQNINNGYDTYDSCIVAAETEEEAREIHPSSFVTHYRGGAWYGTYSQTCSTPEKRGVEYSFGYNASWVKPSEINKIIVELIGKASKGTKKGLILSSFNAG